jgi:hypothetical protein
VAHCTKPWAKPVGVLREVKKAWLKRRALYLSC